MDLRCPYCESSDLKRASLAYEEGLFRENTRTRLMGWLIGDDGSDLFVGTARTRGLHQTQASKSLSPPARWSYGKLVLWAFTLSMVAIVAFVNHVNSSPPPVSSLPIEIYFVVATPVFVFLGYVFLRHNLVTYQKQYSKWERSFICQRCGAVSLHDVPQGDIVSFGKK